MGSRRPKVGLPTFVSHQTVTFDRSLPPIGLNRPGKERNTLLHLLRPSKQRRHRDSPASPHARVLQPPILRTKEDRRSSTNNRPKRPQHLPEHPKVPDGNSSQYQEVPSCRPMDLQRGSEGRVLPHTNSSRLSAIPQVSGPRPSVSIQGPSFRPELRSVGIHHGRTTSQSLPAPSPSGPVPVPRRLAQPSPVSRESEFRVPNSPRPLPSPGPPSQLREVGSDPQPEFLLSGSRIRSHSWPNQTDAGQLPVPDFSHPFVPVWPVPVGPHLAVPPRFPLCSGEVRSIWSFPHALPSVAASGPLEPALRFPRPFDSSFPSSYFGPSVVAPHGSSSVRGSPYSPIPHDPHFHGCFHCRMGSPLCGEKPFRGNGLRRNPFFISTS